MIRIASALVLLWFVFFFQQEKTVPTPDETDNTKPAMHREVEPVARILRNADIFDRMIFASVFEQCADAAEDKLEDVEVTFENTLGMKVFTESALRVAWSRMADATGKYPRLNDTVEGLFDEVIGTKNRPISDEILDDYADLCRALAWAGMPGDE